MYRKEGVDGQHRVSISLDLHKVVQLLWREPLRGYGSIQVKQRFKRLPTRREMIQEES
jgi:hypothetical protein